MREDKYTRNLIVFMVLVTVLSTAIAFTSEGDRMPVVSQNEKEVVAAEPYYASEVKNGIHQPTGLKSDTYLEPVLANCLACHSADVIRNTRLNKAGWESLIRWMQEKQNLWDLGEDKKKIVAYLAENYAPEAQGRRQNLALQPNDWYALEN
jgi:hypothetical protein